MVPAHPIYHESKHIHSKRRALSWACDVHGVSTVPFKTLSAPPTPVRQINKQSKIK